MRYLISSVAFISGSVLCYVAGAVARGGNYIVAALSAAIGGFLIWCGLKVFTSRYDLTDIDL